MKKMILAVVAALTLTGCDRTDLTGIVPTPPSSVSQPVQVCDFSDGRKLYMIRVQRGSDGGNWIETVYFFKNGTDPISVNSPDRVGKVVHNRTTVIIPE